MECQVLTEAGYKHFGGKLALISGHRGYPLKFVITCKICIYANEVTLTELGCEGTWPELKKLVDLSRKRKYRDLVEGPLFQSVKSECSAAGFHVFRPWLQEPVEKPFFILRVMLDETLRLSFQTESNESFRKYQKHLLTKDIWKVKRAVSAILFWLTEVACESYTQQLV